MAQFSFVKYQDTVHSLDLSKVQINFVKSPAALSISFTLLVVLYLLLKNKRTKELLEACGLPTTQWRPRFITYRPFEEEQKLASSTITRILPRMERLGGPYGMYGTVYGVSTAVIHVAHPIPAKAIFGSSISTSKNTNSSHSKRRRSSLFETTGASKAPAYNHFKNFCGEGVFTADGEDWKAKRGAVMHCLIKGINSSTSEISQRLETEANRAANTFSIQIEALQRHKNTNKSINIVPLLQRSTIGLIYRYITHDEPDWAFQVGDEERQNGQFDSSICQIQKTKSKTANSLLENYLNSIIRIRMIILAQSRAIWFLLPRWCYQWFSSLYRDEEQTVCPIRTFARNAVNRAKPGSPLIKLKERGCHDGGGKGGFGDIPKDLLDETITLLFAGQDTSAATLSWTLHLLSLHPKIQSKVVAEVKLVFQEDGITPENPSVTKKSIMKMPYLDAVIKEAMRLYPVAPFVVRKLVQNILIFDDKNAEAPGIALPEGSLACVWIYGLHHNPTLWDRPDDFLPDRWIDPYMKDPGQTNGAYMPFASGPRNCVGQPLAFIILRTLLSRIIFRYEFRDAQLAKGEDPAVLRKDMQAGFTVLPNGGVTLTVLDRQ
jgi:cytochrome P450